jgi:hypothetical protein
VGDSRFDTGNCEVAKSSHGFFSYQGATTLNIVDPPQSCAVDSYKWGHLAMTYTSIAILVILGDDLSRLDRRGIIEGELQPSFFDFR